LRFIPYSNIQNDTHKYSIVLLLKSPITRSVAAVTAASHLMSSEWASCWCSILQQGLTPAYSCSAGVNHHYTCWAALPGTTFIVLLFYC